MDPDNSIFYFLPEDVLSVIGTKLDPKSLGRWGLSNRKFHSLFYHQGKLAEMLRIILQPSTHLNLSHFTKNELIFLSRVRNTNSISAGEIHSLFLDSQGRVANWGWSDEDSQEPSTPVLLTTFQDPDQLLGADLAPVTIVSISAGDRHGLLLDSQGQVFSFGYNGEGTLGFKDNRSRHHPTLITFPDRETLGQITAISAGLEHSLLCNSRGQVFSFGHNEYGQLGLGHKESQNTPTLIEDIGFMIDVSAGDQHSLFLDSQGRVFSCGRNNHGQLGHGDIESRNMPTLIRGVMKPIIAISAGGEHSLILSSQGQVFSFGCGGIGQLGGGGSWSHRPEPIKQLKFDNNTYIYNYVITSISAGNFHSLLLDDQGRVFACGANDDGRLGLGDRGCRLIPTLIKTTHKINEISAGGEYSLLSDHKSRVYSTGNNEHGQLGLGGLDDRLAPILIEKLSII